ncbi:MAG TPA: toll/interleukin-1 receptor domain-containing protein, partial [Hyalangium sp.]|nr:toll/interleukin-1 receptor domain-containing protein [Hyalangium sp.]
MVRVLLSHASIDRPKARRLAEGLRRAGYEPWLLEDELPVGSSLPEVLERGVRDSQFVVACLSLEALRSGWVEAELRLILEKMPRERSHRLIPVRFEEVELPAGLRDREAIDVLEDRWDEGVAKLGAVLHDLQSAPLEQPRAASGSIEPGDEATIDAALNACTPPALQLMKAATAFSPGPIPTDWLVAVADQKGDHHESPAALSELSRLGLLQADEHSQQVTPNTLAVLRLKQRLRPDEAEKLTGSTIRTMALWVLNLADPRNPETAAEFERRRSQIEGVLRNVPSNAHPLPWSALAMRLGWILAQRGESRRAHEAAEKALEVSVSSPLHHSFALASLMTLAHLARAEGDYTQAKTHLERAIALAQTLQGEDKSAVLSEVLAEFASLVRVRDPIAAKKTAQQALELAESAPDVTDEVRAQRLNVLAFATLEAEGPAAARPLFEQVLQVLEKSGREDTPFAATVLAGLASTLRQLGELEGAGKALERALFIERRELGPASSNVALRLANLAEVRAAEGLLAEAKELFGQSQDILESQHEPEPEGLGTTLHNLGITLFKLGDLEGARQSFERSVKLLELAYGPEHPYVARSRAGLVRTLKPGSEEAKR